jgi:F-type H+-transporting ATPase subunit b
MPQLSQLPYVLWSQLLWLAIGLGFIFFVIARGMVPKIQRTVEDREKRISADLEAARLAREEAEQTESRYREQINASRAEAMKLAQAAKEAGARDAEKRISAASSKMDAKLQKAEAKIREAAEAARGEIETVAVEATRDIFEKLTGTSVPAADATRAVKAVANG